MGGLLWRGRSAASTGSAWPAAMACASAGSPPAWAAPPLLYFGVLLAGGLRPRDFSRRA